MDTSRGLVSHTVWDPDDRAAIRVLCRAVSTSIVGFWGTQGVVHGNSICRGLVSIVRSWWNAYAVCGEKAAVNENQRGELMSQQFDAIVVGAGHNGLTTANYLALQGLNVCVLERRHIVGGAAVSEEFHPGYRNSIASYVVSLLRPEVVKDLKLADYGYETIPLNHAIYLDSEGTSLLFSDDEAITKKEFAKFSSKDYDAYMALHDVIDKVGDVVAKQWLQTPPKLAGGGLFDLLSTTKLGLDFYRLDQDARHRFMQLMIGTPDSMIERWFESDKVKAIMAQHCTPANYASLQQPGAAIAMLHHAVGQLDGVKGAWGLVKGGMGGITPSNGKCCRGKRRDHQNRLFSHRNPCGKWCGYRCSSGFW